MRYLTKLILVGAVAIAACAAPDERMVDAPGSGGDAAASGDGGIDGAANGNGVLCARADQSCVAPTPQCCDLATGIDTCIAANGACAGDRLECDGPEDCFVGQECCLFDGQGSRCLDEGICGTTGSISNEMCHVQGDCDLNEMCCGTAPGPAIDLYSVCTQGPCPQ